jgi:hypothetical protein
LGNRQFRRKVPLVLALPEDVYGGCVDGIEGLTGTPTNLPTSSPAGAPSALPTDAIATNARASPSILGSASVVRSMPSPALDPQGTLRPARLRKGLLRRPTAADIYDVRGIDRQQGCLVVARPDQYIAHVLPLGVRNELVDFFAGVLRRSAVKAREFVQAAS